MDAMRRPALLLVVVALALAAGATAQTAPGAYLKIVPLRGHIGCGASAGDVSTEDRCGSPAPGGLQRFDIDFDTNLTGVLVEIDWTSSTQLGPTELRIELSRPIDVGETSAWQGGPKGRFLLERIRADEQAGPGSLGLLVVPPKSSPKPAVVNGQDFELAVTFLHNGAQFPPGYSGLGSSPGIVGPASVPPETAPATSLVPAESAGWSRAAWGATAVAIGLAALAVPRVRRVLAAGAAAALFTRLDEDRILAHPRRAELLALVRARPGIGAEAARAELDVGRGAFGHHLRVLEVRRLVRRLEVDGRILLYAADLPRAASPQAVGVAARVMGAVRDEPGLRQVDLALRLGLPERTLRHHALWLARRGRLRLEADGRAVRCWPA
jgi:DNA-binding transcriptional ArsR family regulator